VSDLIPYQDQYSNSYIEIVKEITADRITLKFGRYFDISYMPFIGEYASLTGNGMKLSLDDYNSLYLINKFRYDSYPNPYGKYNHNKP